LKESGDGETLMAVGIWFQIWGAAKEKARHPKSVFAKVSRLLSVKDLVRYGDDFKIHSLIDWEPVEIGQELRCGD